MNDAWLDGQGGASSVRAAVLRSADGQGLGRASGWAAGQVQGAEDALQGGRWRVHVDARGVLEGCAAPAPRASIASLLRYACAWRVGTGCCRKRVSICVLHRSVLEHGHELSESDMVTLLHARGDDFDAVCHAADALRQAVNGDTVTYVVNRNINYTNVCTYKYVRLQDTAIELAATTWYMSYDCRCSFCAFSKGPANEALRGAPYLLPLEEVQRRAVEAWERGATEVCMQVR